MKTSKATALHAPKNLCPALATASEAATGVAYFC